MSTNEKINIRKSLIFTIFAIVVLFASFGIGKADVKRSEVSSKMKMMVRQFHKIYKLKPKTNISAVVAVLPFRCEKKLAEKRIGIAVAEILTYYLTNSKRFKVVERIELERIFEEQKLSLTGAIESRTAIKVGRLLGARLLVLGNVNRMGKFYQISARLVDAQTSEVIITDIIEVGIKNFEDEAAPYLVIVPDKQAIGLYFLGEMTPNYMSQSYHPITYEGTYESVSFSATIKPEPLEMTAPSYGLGMRYFPCKWLMIDLAYKLQDLSVNGQIAKLISPEQETNGRNSIDLSLRSSAIAIAFNNVLNFSNAFKGYLGIGADLCFLEYKISPLKIRYNFYGEDIGICIQETVTPHAPHDYEEDSIYIKNKILNTCIKIGLEWRPQSRLGIGLIGKYFLFERNFEPVFWLNVNSWRDDQLYFFSGSKVEIFNLQPRKFALATTISFYF